MTDDFTPDLSGLAADFRILTELRHSTRSRTYLARHVGLNRDVTIRVVAAPGDGDSNSLTHFASDARTLSTIRHPAVVPVVEGRWLADGTLAVVRARARGVTLDAAIQATERFPLARIASTLEQVYAAIVWARDNGIAHRNLPGDAVTFQQGSGRVLVELDLFLDGAGRLPDAYDDGRTIERLAYAMLTRRPVGDVANEPLTESRLDLPPRIIRELSALSSPDRAQPPHDPRVLIGLLNDTKGVEVPPFGASAQQAPPAPAVPAPPVASPAAPKRVGETKRRFNFGTWVVMLAVLSTAAGAAGTLLLQRGPVAPRTSTMGGNSRGTVAAGEVVLRHEPTDPSAAASAPAADSRPVEPPAGRFHEPLQGTSVPVMPVSSTAAADSSRAIDAKPGSGPTGQAFISDICNLPGAEDQHTCLAIAVERGDKDVNVAYQRLIETLRRRATVADTDPDPAVVEQLRKTQRAWLEVRDKTCHDVGSAPMYARTRAQCFADQSMKRLRELQQMLDTTTAG